MVKSAKRTIWPGFGSQEVIVYGDRPWSFLFGRSERFLFFLEKNVDW